jgi:4-amino-4-deoxy-L-arabinose transferase-like glycosyltransferase
MSGIVHPYYTVALAPAIGALVAIGGRALWRARHTIAARLALATAVLATGSWAYVLLDRTPSWHPALRIAVPAAAALAAALLLLGPIVGRRRPLIAVLAAFAMLGAPAAFALETASTAHTGSIPTAGPSSGGSGFGGGRGGTRAAGGLGFGSSSQQRGTPPSGVGSPPSGSSGTARQQFGGGAATTSSALVTLLKADTTHRWVAAAIGSQSAAPLELATGRSVIAIGGFSGTDPAPTLAQFEALVAKGEIHYLITGGAGGSGTASQITSWVSSHFSSKTVGGQTIYDLTKPTS